MKPKYLTTILAAAACLLCSASSLRAQVPQIVDYHGQLLGVDASFDGPVQFKFVLVNSTGTTTYWSNDGTSSAGSQPTNAVTITVNSGLYVVGLGDTTITHMHALPTTVFATSGVYLRTWFNDGTNGWQLVTPDRQIGAAGYAMMAAKVATASIGSGQLASNLTLFGTTKAQGVLALSGTTSSTVGVLTMGGVSFMHDLGLTNTFLGATSGNFTMTGIYNTATGMGAESSVSSGGFNTALGDFALVNTTTGSNNIAIGYDAGLRNTSASNNIYIGNEGQFTDDNVVRIGEGQSATYLVGQTNVQSGLTVDTAGQNSGSIQGNALTFGKGGSGEGILSNRSDVFNPDLEFWTNFTNRLEILTNGNVGIGTTAPQSLLTVQLANAGGRGGELSIVNNAAPTVGNEAALNFGAEDSTYGGDYSNAQIKARLMNVSSDTDMVFSLYNGLGNGGYGERMRIQGAGNVGIGTQTPTQKLEVNGEYLMVDGNGGVQVYVGDDGSGNDVQIGSLKAGVTNVACFNATDGKFMRMVCSSIQINGGSDLAEPFAITKAKHPVAEGNVVVIDDANPGHLTLTDRPYDTRVAGVVSGANGVHPGIQMRQDGLLDGDQNVALTGRVYVLADTSNGAIAPGDMLTTSGTPGVAMRVTDHVRAQGAILGKAMTGLRDGHGMVLVLVTLQ